MKTTTIRLPIDLHQQFKKEAARLGFTMNHLVIQILRGWLEQNRKKED